MPIKNIKKRWKNSLKKETILLRSETQKVQSEKIDLLPNFRETFSAPDKLDDDGSKSLAKSILIRTAQDYFKVCLNDEPEFIFSKSNQEELSINALCTRHMLESFIDGETSDLFESITDIDPKTFKKGIKELRKRTDKFPSLYTISANNGNYIQRIQRWNGNIHYKKKQQTK